MTLLQEIAVNDLVNTNELDEPKTLLYPLNLTKDARIDSPTLDDVTKYRSIIGGLSYLSMYTRPDMSMVVLDKIQRKV